VQVLHDTMFPDFGNNIALLEGCQAALAVYSYLKSSVYRVRSVGGAGEGSHVPVPIRPSHISHGPTRDRTPDIHGEMQETVGLIQLGLLSGTCSSHLTENAVPDL
jgi:hypothetical protein